MSDLETKEQIKERLMRRYKAFRNYSMKIAILFASLTFAGHFCLTVTSGNPASMHVEEAFLRSALFSIGFGVLGYCIGSFVGTVMHQQHFRKLESIRHERARALQDQMSIRQARLTSMREMENKSVI